MKVTKVMRSFFKIILLFGLTLLMACEKDITDKVKVDSTKRLVVTCFISPQDTVLQVQVQETKPILGKYPSNQFAGIYLNNAVVNLHDGNKEIQLPNIFENGMYQVKASDFPITAGKTYFLTVTVPDGRKATASCVVPLTENIAVTEVTHSEKVVTYDYDPGRPVKEHTFKYKWQDAPNQENYYLPLAILEEQVPNPPPNQPTGRDLIFVNEETYISDDRKDGTIFTSSEGMYTTAADNTVSSPFTIQTHLVVSDRAYYLYHRSLYMHNNVKDNPFAEPAIIYTNVQGGLGVFSGYNQLKKVFRIP